MENDNQNIISGFGYPSEETKEAIDKLWEKVRFLGRKVIELRSQYEDSVEYNKHLEHQISQQNEEIDKFQARTIVLDKLIEQTGSTEDELLDSLSSIKGNSEELDKAIMDLEFAAKDITTKNQMIAEKDETILKLKDHIALLENEINSSNSSSEDTEKIKSEMDDKIKKLNSKINSDEYTISELRKRRDEIEKELNELKLNTNSVPVISKESKQEISSLKTKVTELESKLKVAMNDILIKDKTIADSHTAFEELQRELSSSEAMRRELEEKAEQFTQFETFTNSLKAKLKELEGQLQIKNNEYLMKDSKVNELLRSNKELEDRIKELKIKKDNFESQLMLLRKEASNYNEDMISNDMLMERLRNLSEAKSKIESDKFELTNKNQELQLILKKRYEQIDILERQINNMLELDKLEIGDRNDIASKIDSLVENFEKNYNKYISSMNNK